MIINNLSVDDNTPACCWICLSEHGTLTSQCKCPASHTAHAECVAQWRFVRAGTEEERSCRFCSHAYTPLVDAFPHLERAQAPVMTLNVHGSKHAIPVVGGEWGRMLFEADVRRLYGLGDEEEVDISFSCVVPGTDMKVILSGWQCYDAAYMAAAIACAAGSKEDKVEEDKAGGAQQGGLLQRVMRTFFQSGDDQQLHNN